MATIAARLRQLSEFYTRPHVEYAGKNNQLRKAIQSALARHSVDLNRDGPIDAYRVLALSQPMEPDLEKCLKESHTLLPRGVGPVPRFEITHAGLMDVRRIPPDFIHAAVLSTFLEHEPDPVASLKRIHAALRPDGLLIAVLHDRNDTLPGQIREGAHHLEFAFRALHEYAEGKIDGRQASNRLQETMFPQAMGIQDLGRWLKRFKINPASAQTVKEALDNRRFSKALLVAERIEKNASTLESGTALLEKAGFYPVACDNLYERSLKRRIWRFAAFKDQDMARLFGYD